MKTIEKIKTMGFVMLVAIAGITFTACGNDDEEDVTSSNGNGSESDNYDNYTYELLKKNVSATVSYGNYSWNIRIKSNLANVFPNKEIIYGVESGYGKYQYYEHFKFRTEYLQTNDGKGNIVVNYPVFVGNEYGELLLYWETYRALQDKKAHGKSLTSDEKDLWNEIIKIMNKEEFNAKNTFCGRLYAQFDNTRYIFHSFGKEASSNTNGDMGGDEPGDTGGGSYSYEKPEIGLENYTCTTTSITVKYRIYNQNEAKVTSAKGYYGTSSASKAVSASVSGSLITIRISNLKKGTTYYVKCSATGKGGTTTTETTKFITNY